MKEPAAGKASASNSAAPEAAETSGGASAKQDGRKARTRRRAYLPADERKQQILRAAQEAFSRSSLHGVSTRDIARAADINPATLFEHFGTKEALFREAVIAPLFKELRELKSRVSVYQAASQEMSVELAEAGVQRQMGVMKRLFPLLTTALFSDLELGKELYRAHMIPLIEERVKMTLGLAKAETDPYFLELIAVGILFVVAMDETFGDGRLSRATAAEQLVRLITFGTARRPHDVAPARASPPGSELRDLRRLGASDLWVSPLALEAIDFATIARSASADRLTEVFGLYIQRGGNFIETTNYFADDALEALVGRLVRERRDEIVLASNHRLLDSAGRTRKSGSFGFRLVRSVEEHLGRLGVDCLDLLYVNGFEHGVQAEELVEACSDLVKQGKIRHAGYCDIPAWQVSRIHTVAEGRGRNPFVGLRARYGVSARAAERDLFPMAVEMGLGVTTYPAPPSHEPPDSDRIALSEISPVIHAVAEELGKKPSQVALAWQFHHSGIVAELVHPHNAEELEAKIAALQIVLSEDQIDRLEKVGRPQPD